MKKRLTIEVADKREFEELEAALQDPETRPLVRILGVTSRLEPTELGRLAEGIGSLSDLVNGK